MIFEKENLKNQLIIEANKDNKKIKIYKLIINTEYNEYDYKDERNYETEFSRRLLENFDVLSILEENKEAFGLTQYPNKEFENRFYYIYSFLKKDGWVQNNRNDDDNDIIFLSHWSIIAAIIFKILSENFNGKFWMPLIYGNTPFILYLDKNESINNIERKIENEIIDGPAATLGFKHWSSADTNEEILAPSKFSHTDYFGNEIKIGDIGAGCAGKGRTFGLEVQQIISMTKVFINTNIRPENFIVLKPIDGRPLKGVN